MKRTKSSPAKRAGLQTKHNHRARRSIHKRVLLHPFTVFVLLCVGVLVAGSTFKSQAETYDVTATVPAAAVTEQAVISEPANGQHLATPSTVVVGSCPAQTYVKLYRGSVFSGTAPCVDGRFSITTTLSPGSNELKARIFNLTDQEGPDSTLITIYYDLPITVKIPSALPTSLQVSNVDQGSYQSGLVREVGSNPTISGLAPPFSDIVVTFYSIPSVCRTKANAKGVWSCTLGNSLAPGLHHVVITATTPGGKVLIFPAFEIKVTNHAEPFMITSDYKYKAYHQGQSYSWELGLRGGTAPYEVLVDWGDGSTSRIVRQDTSEFAISHNYDSLAVTEQNYTVLITATDARKATTVLQLTATIKGTTTPVSSQKNMFSVLLSGVEKGLWVVWPVYIGVVLMALSFWIGEREAYQRFVVRKRLGRQPASRGRVR